ncbi:MarR family transcriptional regulator [Paenibacillus sp. N4]|uniref:MarR family winged helix-turn-helix transcriptional regulator n=1 Tax=Paenibacillus vietnamensis TaxID=2590547 RepID=UPI001CD044E8|nr:MarR family transcriptional regulator [Paenibacillus vietnamensis]MCA0754795.1 MarR family transcriptional regulator [Paenibacillus vietnamensis]
MSTDKYENVTQLMEVFQRFAKADWRKKTIDGLKPSEIRVLVRLKNNLDNGGASMTVSELSKILQVTSPTVTQMINSLLASGHVNRSADPSDRRITEITLTDKGSRFAEKALERYHALFKGVIDRLGKEQSDQLIVTLNQLFDYLESYSYNE